MTTTGQSEQLQARARAFIARIEPDLAGVMTAGALIEELLGVRCGAQGKGLGIRWREVKHLFPAHLDDKMGVIIGARNSVAHEAFAQIRSKGRFVSAAREVIQALLDFEPPRKPPVRLPFGVNEGIARRAGASNARGTRFLLVPAGLAIAAFVAFTFHVSEDQQAGRARQAERPEMKPAIGADPVRVEIAPAQGRQDVQPARVASPAVPAPAQAAVAKTSPKPAKAVMPERPPTPDPDPEAPADGPTLDHLRTLTNRL